MQTNASKIAMVVGAGPVGCISTIFLSKRGFQVDLYEARSDIRSAQNASGKTINVVITERGLAALKEAGLGEDFVTALEGIGMHSRHIHTTNEKFHILPYGKKGQELLTINRLKLNCLLLTEAENRDNVTVHFKHKLIGCDMRTPTATFKLGNSEVITHTGDVLLGCDGAHSGVRHQMIKGRMNYSQSYIDHVYKEIRIPPTKEGDFAFSTKCFHVWPRHEFMIVAHPNMDKSLTSVLMLPFSKFETLVTGDDVIKFFKEYFEEILNAVGEQRLISIFFSQPPLPVVEVKCNPFHAMKAVLLGDAAHAVTPFYGQGLNSGLEDALIFDNLLEQYDCDLSTVLPRFSQVRIHDAHTVVDMSHDNYVVLRSRLASPWFNMRQKINAIFSYVFPFIFMNEIEMMFFTRMSYGDIAEQSTRQNKIIDSVLLILICCIVILFAWVISLLMTFY